MAKVGFSTRRLPRIAVVLALLVLGFLAARLVLLWYARARLADQRAELQRVVGSLELGRLAPPPVPAERNAAHWILQAVAAVDRHSDVASRLNQLDRRELGELGPVELAEARELLAGLPLTTADWHRIATLEGSDFGIAYDRGWQAEIPNLVQLLGVARVASIEARVGVAGGDQEAVVPAAGAIAGMARALCRETTLITHLVGGAVERGFHRALADYLAAGRWSIEALDALASQLERTDCGSAIGRAVEAESALAAAAPEGTWTGPPPEGLARLSAWLELPFDDLRMAALLEGRRREIEHLEEDFLTYHRLYKTGAFKPRWFGGFYEILTPNLVDAIGKARATQAGRRLALRALDAARARLGSGEFPREWPAIRSPYSGLPFVTSPRAGGGLVIEEPGRGFDSIENAATRPQLVWIVPEPALP